MDSGSMMAYKRIVPRGVTLITFTIQGDTVAPMDTESYNVALMKLQAVQGNPSPIAGEADFLNEWLDKYDAAQKKQTGQATGQPTDQTQQTGQADQTQQTQQKTAPDWVNNLLPKHKSGH